jgi:hypothetical protein
MERHNLTITEVRQPRQVGQAEVLEFVATNSNNKPFKYGVWSKPLYQHIKQGAVIDAEVDIKISDKLDPNGQPYENRKVTQIYVNNEPVLKKAKAWGGHSPEDRESIEIQTAVKAVTDLWNGGKLTTTDPEVKLLRIWLVAHLTNKLTGAQRNNNI